MERTVLLTGFMPFGAHDANPSQAVVESLDGHLVAGVRVAGRVLPVTAEDAPQVLAAALTEVQPVLVLGLGLAAGRDRPTPERVAINVLDFPIADNAGRQPLDLPVVSGGPAAYFATLPLRAILAAWGEAGIPGSLSNTAGTYVCNAVMYHALHLTRETGIPTGFIHLPQTGEDGAALTLTTLIHAVELAIAASLGAIEVDRAVVTGAVS